MGQSLDRIRGARSAWSGRPRLRLRPRTSPKRRWSPGTHMSTRRGWRVMSSDASALDRQHHHPALAHHFDNLAQQREASTLGMWLFLATEVLFFGGLFMAYSVYRSWYPEAFAAASHSLDLVLGTVNTAVLIT